MALFGALVFFTLAAITLAIAAPVVFGLALVVAFAAAGLHCLEKIRERRSNSASDAEDRRRKALGY